MPSKFNIASTAFCIAILAHDYRVARRNRTKYEKIVEENETLLAALEYVEYQRAYLGKVLERHGIMPDEFDFIAMNNPDLA